MPDQAGNAKSETKIVVSSKKRTSDLPLDFSFKEMLDVTELPGEEARETLPGRKPQRSGGYEGGKYRGTCLKLNNNLLKEISGLPATLGELIFNPLELTWIDLSCNELSVIDEALCDFRSLQILYLQGNQIQELKEVDKLQGMPKLRKLNLHGNPMDREKGYRLYCLKTIPQLQYFDCSLVTKADRKTAECFKPDFRKKKKGQDS